MIVASQVTPEVAAWVLHHFVGAREGLEPGDFTSQLIHTIALADPMNKLRLASVFPAEGYAVMMYQQVDNGVDLLRMIRDSELPGFPRELPVQVPRCEHSGPVTA